MKKNLSLILFTSFIVLSCNKSTDDGEVRPVRYKEISLWNQAKERTFSGVAQADMDAHLSFRVPGVIQELPIHIGQKVLKNEVLATLDSHDYQLKVQEAQAAYIQALAKVRQTSANYDRIRLLYEKKNASRNELDLARAEAESSSAALQVSEKRLELAQSQLKYTTLSAPFSGSIAAIPAEVNENVAAGQHILLLSSASDIEVSTSLPEKIISQIHLDTPVEVTFDAIKDQSFSGTVKEIGIMSDVRTTYPVTVSIDTDTSLIRSGMTAEVHFSFKDMDHAAIVPSHALLEKDGQEYVFVIERTTDNLGIIHLQEVRVGELCNHGIEILHGVHANDLIVTAGLRRLKDGQKVLLLPDNEER